MPDLRSRWEQLSPRERDALVEKLAAIAHGSWAGWFQWMEEKWWQIHSSGEPFRERWKRQAATPYEQLHEQEKESDRIEARKYLAALLALGVK